MNRPLAEILQQLERDFGNAAEQAREAQRRQAEQTRGPQASHSKAMSLPVDTIETDDAIWYFADLPGLEKKDLQVLSVQRQHTY